MCSAAIKIQRMGGAYERGIAMEELWRRLAGGFADTLGGPQGEAALWLLCMGAEAAACLLAAGLDKKEGT